MGHKHEVMGSRAVREPTTQHISENMNTLDGDEWSYFHTLLLPVAASVMATIEF